MKSKVRVREEGLLANWTLRYLGSTCATSPMAALQAMIYVSQQFKGAMDFPGISKEFFSNFNNNFVRILFQVNSNKHTSFLI